MRCGLLIIGSLLWDNGTNGSRDSWRKARLNVSAQMPVTAPFYYGRKSQSRGDTFTMTFGTGELSAQGVLVPCVTGIKTINDLAEEAGALWHAEDANAKPSSIHKPWGCVGALFGSDIAHSKLVADWGAYFRKAKAPCISITGADGRLNIPWPNTMEGQPVDLDVILATATEPDVKRPAPRDIADAWCAQRCGYERYFFENVRHSIRTPADGNIWRRIEELSPSWLRSETYKQAVDILRSEAATQNQQ